MKRLTAMILALCVFFSVQTSFVSAESTSQKTETRAIEEILEEYHLKAMNTQFGAEKNGETSRSASSGKTLEQETVEELTTAGYEAYNVTGNNYKDLEKTLKTDLSSLGIHSNGSYIVVVSGENCGDDGREENKTNSRLGGNVIEQVGGTGDGTGGSSVVMHTYNGKTYTMRYVTVTATDDAEQRMRSYINLREEYGVEDLWNDLDIYVTLISSVSELSFAGILYSWISALLPDIEDTDGELKYFANTNWNIKYIQVYDYQTAEWVTSASTEFVTASCSLIYAEYNPVTMVETPRTIPGYTTTVYAEYYTDETAIKDFAAISFLHYSRWRDTVDYVEHKFDGETVVEHQRDMFW